MKSNVAGPTLRAVAAASVNRLLVQSQARGPEGPLAKHYSEGSFEEEIDGIRLVTTNVVERGARDEMGTSTLSCSIKHPLWTITFTDRRQLVEGWRFERVAPQGVTIQGDLLDAARYLDVPRELFLGALRADGWSSAEIAIERLRWLDLPYTVSTIGRNALMRFL